MNKSTLKKSVSLAAAATVAVLVFGHSNRLGAMGAPRPVETTAAPAPQPMGAVPSFDHVYVIVEENHSYGDVVGNKGVPYFNSLLNKYGSATQFYGNVHPSIGNYFEMTSGVIVSTNDSYNKTVTIDNMVRELVANGKTWRAYAEGLPSIGYVGGNTGRYVRRHNPLSFYSDVVNDSAQRMNLVPMTQLQVDFAAHTMANYSFIVPDLDDNAHDGSMTEADSWLKNNVDPIIQSSDFQNNGLMIITFDEGSIFDGVHGGGHIPTIVISSKVKPGYKSNIVYQHGNLLSLTCQALRLKVCPGSGAQALDMSDFF